jgi:triosephosphate isomerase
MMENMRGWMVAGNWKMHNTIKEAIALTQAIKNGIQGLGGGEIVIAPPFTALMSVHEIVKDTQILIAAQDMFYEDKGAYTGEISPIMLKDQGCTYVIIGHSERRRYFHETDETVNLKAKRAISTGLKPIICVGETEDERERGVTEFVVGMQVKKALYGLDNIEGIVIAYEPVWAIGTGKNATPIEAEEVHHFIRHIIADSYGDRSKGLKVLYGGSVTPENIENLIQMEDIDGALVGGASLKAESFTGIINKVVEIKRC